VDTVRVDIARVDVSLRFASETEKNNKQQNFILPIPNTNKILTAKHNESRMINNNVTTVFLQNVLTKKFSKTPKGCIYT